MGIEEMLDEKINDWDDCLCRHYVGETQNSDVLIRAALSDMEQLKSSLPTQPELVEVPELQFPQSVVDWLETPTEENHDELLSYIMRYYWNEDSAYDDTIPSEVGEYLAESLSNVVKLLRAMEGESYTVKKEQLYYVRLKNTNLIDSNHCYLWLNQSTKEVFFEQKNIKWTNEGNVKNTFTEQEITAISDGAFADNKAFEAVPVETNYAESSK